MHRRGGGLYARDDPAAADLVGLIAACLIYALLANVFGLGKPVDFTLIHQAAWFGMPHMTSPTFNAQAMMLIAPVAVIPVAENLAT